MTRHIENTRAVIECLTQHPAVEQVIHPELPSHPDHALAQQLLPKGAGAVLAVIIHGGRAAGEKFIESLSLISHLANIGDAKTLVIHPASTTHHRMSAKDLANAGIHEGLVRLSIGLEDAKDLIADLNSALRRSQRT